MGKAPIIFTTLAGNQTDFFVGVGLELKKLGHEVGIISYHELSIERVRNAGIKVWSGFDWDPRLEASLVDEAELERRFAEVISRLRIDNPARLFSHESTSFRIFDLQALKRKFVLYFNAVERALDEASCISARNGGPAALSSSSTALGANQPVMVQEAGGFMSLIASFYGAQARHWRHWFFEPSFFRGRVLFNLNTFMATKIRPSDYKEPRPEVVSYLERVMKSNQIVIPKKDAWQYAGVFGKILTRRNFRRLFEKVVEKHVRGKREEFSHIGNYVRRHLWMMISRVVLHREYQKLPRKPFVYFPLHVPMDVALTVRAPAYLDQITFIDFLARNVPLDHVVAIKEHPALVGAMPLARLRTLLKERQNVVLLDPNLNNFDVMRASSMVVTVNSKSGSEALLCHKNVIVLGDAFYTECDLVKYVTELINLDRDVRDALKKPFDDRQLAAFFQGVWDKSLPGEVYDTEPASHRVFAESIAQTIAASSPSAAAAVEVQNGAVHV